LEDFNGSTGLYKIDSQQLEDEEINKPYYYKWKRVCVLILSSFESIYGEIGNSRFIEKYRRIAYDQVEELPVQTITSGDVTTKYSINLRSFEVRAGVVGEEKEVPYSN
jgi:hypothetical protein